MRTRWILGCLVCMLGLAARPLAAQRVAGTVVEREGGAGIAAALVQLIAPDSTVLATAFTDDAGAFAFADADADASARAADGSLFVSRLGYRSLRSAIRDLSGSIDALRVPLDGDAVPLDEIRVDAEARRNRWLASYGFYDRQKLGFGQFITREMLETRFATATRTSEVLRRVPGVFRAEDRYFSYTVVYMRGSQASISLTPCPAAFYVNGMYQGKALDRLNPQDIEAIEVYPGPASVPVAYGGANAMCGVVLIWLRLG